MLANKLISAATVVQKDNYLNYVAMLLHADGTNGANNNTFIDSSVNNIAITAGSSTTQGSLNPYGNNWSNYFNGTTDYLTLPDSAVYATGTNNFTLECWINPSQTSASFARIISQQGSAGYWGLRQQTNTLTYFYLNAATGATVSITSGAVLTSFVWHHVAVVRNGNDFTLYVDGVSVATGTSAGAVPDIARVVAIGAYFETSASEFFTGYISNIRLVSGSAIYTAAFSPPTTPLAAVAGTSLLTCQSNRFSDKSSNNFIVTMIGSSKVLNFSPFKESSDYSAGSLFFSADAISYLTTASNTAFAAGTGAFTWEAWFYPNSFSQDANLGDILFLVNTTNGLLISKTSTALGNSWGIAASGVGFRVTSTTNPIIGQWNHMAVSRSGTGTNQTALWLNGVRIAVGTSADNFAQGPLLVSNSSTSNDLDGWLADVRFVKGTAIYNPASTTYTIPTSPLTAVTNTSLLLSGKNAAIYDSVSKGDLVTLSNVQLDTSVKKFGTASLAFTSTGGRIRKYYDTLFDIVTGTFTFEAWVYPTVSSTGHRIFATGGGSAGWNNTNGIHVLIQMANGKLNLQLATNTATPIGFSTTDEIPVNQWTFITVSVIGTTAYLGVNGNVVSGSVSTRARPSSNPTLNLGLIPGEALGSVFSYLGYMDEVRFTTGVARYTSSFTPPTAPFPNS